MEQVEAAKTSANTTAQSTLAGVWTGGAGSATYSQVNADMVTKGNNIDQFVQQLNTSINTTQQNLQQLLQGVQQYQQFFQTLSGNLTAAGNNYASADSQVAAKFGGSQ